jgi:hypothetical protein
VDLHVSDKPHFLDVADAIVRKVTRAEAGVPDHFVVVLADPVRAQEGLVADLEQGAAGHEHLHSDRVQRQRHGGAGVADVLLNHILSNIGHFVVVDLVDEVAWKEPSLVGWRVGANVGHTAGDGHDHDSKST